MTGSTFKVHRCSSVQPSNENDEPLMKPSRRQCWNSMSKSAPKRTQRRADRRELVVDTMTAPVAEGGPDLIEWTVMSMGAGAVTGGLVFGFLAEGRAGKSESVGGQLAVEEAKDLATIANVLRARWCWYRDRSCTLVFRRRRPIRPCVCAVVTSDGAFISVRDPSHRGLLNYRCSPCSRPTRACVIDQISVNPMSALPIAMTTVSVVSFAKRVLKRTIKKSRAFVFIEDDGDDEATDISDASDAADPTDAADGSVSGRTGYDRSLRCQ